MTNEQAFGKLLEFCERNGLEFILQHASEYKYFNLSLGKQIGSSVNNFSCNARSNCLSECVQSAIKQASEALGLTDEE